MAETSGSGDAVKPGLRIPRWVLLTWLWLNVPASLFAWYVCDWGSAGSWCAAGQPVLMWTFRLFPMNLNWAFPPAAPEWAAWLAMILATAACHAALVRWLPRQVSMGRFLVVLIGWELLTLATTMLSLFMIWIWTEVWTF